MDFFLHDEPPQARTTLAGRSHCLPTSELARQLGISRSTVQSRLKRLEERKIITGYTIQFGSDYERKLIRVL